MPTIIRPKAEVNSQDYRPIWQIFGTNFRSQSGDNALADACPWCGKDRFYLNIRSGCYHCKHCEQSGNVTTYLTWVHNMHLKATTAEHYLALKERRGIASQTLRRYELAYYADDDCWLIPFKSSKDNVVNIQRYYWNKPKPNKLNLPGLPLGIFGFHHLGDKSKLVIMLEGAFDLMAADYQIGAQNRFKYILLGIPGTFKREWVEHLRGYKVRTLFDNDEGGRKLTEQVRKLLGESGKAAELSFLKWPEGTEGWDINDLICRDPKLALLEWSRVNSIKITAASPVLIYHGFQPASEAKELDWVWPDHMPCGTYVSLSGEKGTFKSTMAIEWAALYTTGRKMPMCDRVGFPAGNVLYIHAEDDRKSVEDRFRQFKGDPSMWHTMPAFLESGEQLNLLEHLDRLREVVREFGIRFVIIDGQNSVVGAPCIATDMLARRNITNPLHQFAQRENICLLGIRNEDPDGRAMGPQSMGDIGRCVIRAVEEPPKGNPPYCVLKFVRVSEVARTAYPDIPYSVEDLGGSSRRILWGRRRPTTDRAAADRMGRKPTKADRRVAKSVAQTLDADLRDVWRRRAEAAAASGAGGQGQREAQGGKAMPPFSVNGHGGGHNGDGK
jgi:hypothetical protein